MAVALIYAGGPPFSHIGYSGQEEAVSHLLLAVAVCVACLLGALPSAIARVEAVAPSQTAKVEWHSWLPECSVHS